MSRGYINFILPLALLFSTAFISPHAFHVSILEVKYSPENSELEFAAKLFTDDLERAMREEMELGVLNIGGAHEAEQLDSMIVAYLDDHFEVKASSVQQEIPFKYVGREGDLDAQWVYFTVPVSKTQNHYNLSYTVFFEIFEDQRNVIHFETPDKKDSFVLSGKTTSTTINL
tara:strand:- start:259 stop:774 length:516 start_codon:yes stop_codon:yes gene_type:complete